MIKITEAQWSIMELLWESDSSMTVSQICRTLEEEKGIVWKANTVNTQLTRLEEHGVVAHGDNAPKAFYPLVDRDTCRRQEERSFLDKMYQGSVKMMIASFIKDEKLTAEELDEIRKLLEDERG
ncbi:MAG: BlaI/MecI/CopY family transcriptional regulator [Firmicutes bacterium]|nr:BlaI/MecI/CopY family transcriptional regulator [Bacillota bacterium]